MPKIRKYDKLKINHTKYGIGVLNGVNINLRHTIIGMNFIEGDDNVFRMFTISTFNFYKMLITKTI
jgi:hypothetical protein